MKNIMKDVRHHGFINGYVCRRLPVQKLFKKGNFKNFFFKVIKYIVYLFFIPRFLSNAAKERHEKKGFQLFEFLNLQPQRDDD